MEKPRNNSASCLNLWQGSILFIAILFHFNVQAQEATLSSGGDATGTGGSVSYSVGQVFYSVHTSADGLVAEGVQLPYEVLTITGLEEALGIRLICYPNPTTDALTLKVEDYDIEKLMYQLYDMNGRLLEVKKLSTNETNIPMVNLRPAPYILKIVNHQTKGSLTNSVNTGAEALPVVKTFKIIKN